MTALIAMLVTGLSLEAWDCLRARRIRKAQLRLGTVGEEEGEDRAAELRIDRALAAGSICRVCGRAAWEHRNWPYRPPPTRIPGPGERRS